MRTVEQIRAGISSENGCLERICQGYPGHACEVSLEGEHVLKKRCHTCKGKNDSARQRFFVGVKRERKTHRIVLTVAQAEWRNMTDAQRTARIVERIRWGTSASEIAETYGITRKRVREINCAHYQRRARIAA